MGFFGGLTKSLRHWLWTWVSLGNEDREHLRILYDRLGAVEKRASQHSIYFDMLFKDGEVSRDIDAVPPYEEILPQVRQTIHVCSQDHKGKRGKK